MTGNMLQVLKYVRWIWHMLLLWEEDYFPNYILIWVGISRTQSVYWKGRCFRYMLMPSKYERHMGFGLSPHTHTHTHTEFYLNLLPFHKDFSFRMLYAFPLKRLALNSIYSKLVSRTVEGSSQIQYTTVFHMINHHFPLPSQRSRLPKLNLYYCDLVISQ